MPFGLLKQAADHTFGALMSGANMWYNSATNEKSYHYTSNLQNRLLNWQEKMSNTAHQRETADLIKAGINPLYTATGGGGATTPSGTGGSVNSPSVDVAGSYMAGLTNLANIRNSTNATNADVALKGAQTQDVIGGMQERLVRMRNMLEERNLTVARRHQIYAAIDETRANIKQLNALTDFNIANARYTNERGRGMNIFDTPNASSKILNNIFKGNYFTNGFYAH